MEDHKSEDGVVVVVGPPPKWRTFLRQNSEKMGIFVEEAVLPKNQRSTQRAAISDHNELRDVEAQNIYTPTVTRIRRQPQKQEIHFPGFITGISLIQVILMHAVDKELMLTIFGYDPHRRYEIWRFITVMLVHSGLLHMWSNVIFQLILGVLLELVHSWKRISIIYFASVVGGSLFITVLQPKMYTVGCSAGVYGLLFSHLSTIILNWNEMDRKCCRLFWLLLYVAFDVGISFYTSVSVSNVGHLGGAITGFLVSILVLKNFVERPWEEKMKKICIGILTAICVIVLIVNIAAYPLYLPTVWNFQYDRTYKQFVIQTIEDTPEYLKTCVEDKICELMLTEYKLNGTIPTTLWDNIDENLFD